MSNNKTQISGLVEAVKSIFSELIKEQAGEHSKIKVSSLLEAIQGNDFETKLATVIKKGVPKTEREKKLKDPNAPKRPLSAFILFSMDQRNSIKLNNPEAKNKDVSSLLGVAWKTLSDKKKEKYVKQAQRLKEEYEEAKKNYARPEDEELAKLPINWRRGSKLKDPNAPKQPKNAFQFYCKAQRDSVKAENPDVKGPEITKLLGQAWKSLSEKAKKPYLKEAKKAKDEYDSALTEYDRPSDEELAELDVNKPKEKKERKAKSTKAKKDPNAPKHAKNAYLFFCEKERVKVQKKFPELKGKDVAKKLGELWKALSDAKKKPFQDLAKADKERYEAEKAKTGPSSPTSPRESESSGSRTTSKAKKKVEVKLAKDEDEDETEEENEDENENEEEEE